MPGRNHSVRQSEGVKERQERGFSLRGAEAKKATQEANKHGLLKELHVRRWTKAEIRRQWPDGYDLAAANPKRVRPTFASIISLGTLGEDEELPDEV